MLIEQTPAHAWDLWGAHNFWLGTPSSKRPADRPAGYGVKKLPGRLILGNPNDLFIGYSKNLPRDGRYFDVVIHGNADNTGIQLPNKEWITYDGKELATLIRSTKSGWNGKKPLRLITCSGGHCEKSWAQDLASALQVKVAAPTEKVWLGPNGKSFGVGATMPEMRTSGTDTDADFRVFLPRDPDAKADYSTWPWASAPNKNAHSQ